MSDYFIRMVERALGGEPAVRPLVPPACVPGPAGAAGIGGGEDSHGEEIRASFPLERQVPEPDGAEPHSTSAAKGIARSKPAEVSHLTAPPADSWQLQPAGLAPVIVPSAEGWERGADSGNAMKNASCSADPFPGPTHASENGPADMSRNVADGVKRGNENAGSGIFETVLNLMRHREAQQHREFLMGREESRIGPPWEPESAEAAEPEHDIAESILRGTGSVTLHEREQLFPRGAERFSAQEESPPSPTIKVSIGRIEIRAAAPQVANAESRRPPAPKLSLDDYLKKQPGRTG